MTKPIVVVKNILISTPVIIIAVIVSIILSVRWYIFSQVNTVAPYQIADTVLIEKIDQTYQYIENNKVLVQTRLIIYKDGSFESYSNYNHSIVINTQDPYNLEMNNAADKLSSEQSTFSVYYPITHVSTGRLEPDQLAIIKDVIDNKKYTRRTEMVISRYADGCCETPKNHLGDHFLIREGNKTIEIENSHSRYDPIEPMMTLLYSL